MLVCELNTKERIPSLLGGRPGGTEITHIWSPCPTVDRGAGAGFGGVAAPTAGPDQAPDDALGASAAGGGAATGAAGRGPRQAAGGGVWCVNIVPEHAMREYGIMKLRVQALYRVAFENRLVRGFLRLVPGLPELLMLGKAFFHEQEIDPATGKPRWDMVVVDSPATGHGVSLLRIPQVVLAVTARGPMADDARRMQSLLTDPVRTSLNIVTLPEAMPVAEAIDLRKQLEGLLRLPTGYVFLNAVRGAVGDDATLGELEALTAKRASRVAPDEADRGDPPTSGGAERTDTVGEALLAIAKAGRLRARRAAVQEGHIDKLRQDAQMPVIALPFIAAERWRFDAVFELSGHLADAVGRFETPPDPVGVLDGQAGQ